MAWRISAVWSWNSHPEPVRAIHRAEDLATDSRAIVKASRRIMKSTRKTLSSKQREELLGSLRARFEKNMNRHRDVEWAKGRAKLESNSEKLWSLHEMEKTGGEPDVVGQDKTTGEYIFFDCSPETPKDRVSVCYDRDGWEITEGTSTQEYRYGHGNGHGHRASDGRRVSRAPEIWRFRYENVELGKNTISN